MPRLPRSDPRASRPVRRPPRRRPGRLRALGWRARSRRGALGFWVAAAALALLTGAVVHGLVADAESARSRYGTTQPVAVATGAIEAADRTGPGDVEVQDRPMAHVPAGAVADVPTGATAVAPIAAGEAVVADRLAPDGLGVVAALLPEGTRAVAVPDGDGGLRLGVGDHVDVLATVDPRAVPDTDPTFAVAEGAKVVDVADDDGATVTIAVEPDEAERIAFAPAQARLTLTLTRGPGS